MRTLIFFTLYFFMVAPDGVGQTKGASIPEKIDTSEKYLFYLHGAIVQAQGPNAVSPYWGPYEYTAILDTFNAYGYNVISEARSEDTDGAEYADKVAKQIKTLLKAGVAPENISVVGASAGGGIAIDISIKVKNSKIKFAVLGVCRWEKWKVYLQENELCGNFLSIYESSDLYGSCEGYFKDQSCRSGFKEIELNLNNGHGFLYKPYKEWMYPLVKWLDGRQSAEVGVVSKVNGDSYGSSDGGSIKHRYDSLTVHGGKIVKDQITGLVWQLNGSENEMTFEEAGQFVNELNTAGFAGHNDWRLPTLQEASSLIKAHKSEAGLYIDPIFDDRQRWIWTGDKESDSRVGLVNFLFGFSGSFHPNYSVYVRCVR